jgi:hypothetical protein
VGSILRLLDPVKEAARQGCQMAYLQTKNPNFGKFWRVLQWKMLLYFMSSWTVLLPLGIFCVQLAFFIIFPEFKDEKCPRNL